MPFLLPRSLVCTARSTQGHIRAATLIGSIYNWGQGVAVDRTRVAAAFKVGAEGGDAGCQNQLGVMLSKGLGIASPDYKQALVWFEKAAAQDESEALFNLSAMFFNGQGGEPSWRRSRGYLQRGVGLGNQRAAESMQNLKDAIQQVTRSHTGNHSGFHAPPPPARPPHGPAGRGHRHEQAGPQRPVRRRH